MAPSRCSALLHKRPHATVSGSAHAGVAPREQEPEGGKVRGRGELGRSAAPWFDRPGRRAGRGGWARVRTGMNGDGGRASGRAGERARKGRVSE